MLSNNLEKYSSSRRRFKAYKSQIKEKPKSQEESPEKMKDLIKRYAIKPNPSSIIT